MYLIRTFLLVLLIGSYLVTGLFEFNLELWSGFYSLILFLTNLFVLNRWNLVISLVSILIGLVSLSQNNVDWIIYIKGMQSNTNLIALMALAPLLGSWAKLPRYRNTIFYYLDKLDRSKNNAHALIVGFTQFIGSWLNMGAIPLGYIITAHFQIKYGIKRTLNSLARGYAYGIFWSPSISAIPIILTFYNLPWVRFVLLASVPVLIFSFLDKTIAWNNIQNVTSSTLENEDDTLHDHQMAEIVIMILFLILIIVLAETILKLKIGLIVCLSAIFIPTMWAIITKQFKEWFSAEVGPYLKSMGSKLSNEVNLFISAGFLTTGLMNNSGLVESVQALYQTNWLNNTFFIVLGVLTVIISAGIIGIHPIVSVSIMLPFLNPGFGGLSSYALALTLTMGWGLGTLCSPLSGLNLMLNSLTGISHWELAYCWNLKWVLFNLPIAAALVVAINTILTFF